MNIDIRTFVLVLGITHLIQVVVFYQQYKTNKNYQGVGWWLLWSIAEIVGFAGILLEGIPAMHSMAIIIQNTCIFLGTIFIYIGVMRFLGKEVNSKIIFAVSTFFVIATVYFTYVDDNAFMRKVIFNAALAGTSLMTAYVLFVHKMPSITSSARFNAAVFLVHGAVFTYRTVTVLSGAHIDDFFRPTLYNYLPVLDALIVSLLWTYGFIIMLNQRLNAEMGEDKEALRKSERQMADIIEFLPDATLAINREGRVIIWNKAIEAMTGIPAAEMIGKGDYAYTIPFYGEARPQLMDLVFDDYDEIAAKYPKINREGDSIMAEAFCHALHNNKGEWVSAKASPLHDQSGNIIGAIESIRDITERKRVEEEKEKLEAQNRQLQKTESLGRMAGAIAHHFNNQLSVVIGNLEMARDEQPKGAPPSKRLTAAMQAAWKSADMSGLMLTYLGQTHDKREPIDFSYSCHKILPLLKEAIQANAIMESDFPSPGPIIIACASEIQQILTNLITNASEAIGENKGTISLSVKTVSPAEIPTAHRHPIDWQPQDNTYACLEVTDTGSGIESKDIEKIFDPFFSTKFTGRGMGLAVVLGLANSYKGVITLDTKHGKGSTFRIFFPVSEEALQQPQTVESDKEVTISSPSPRKMEEGGTVLVVEDEEMLRNMAGTMLESFGFTVLKAKDGIEALDVFGKHQSEIKFVLTDLTMPRMNGWETLTELRKLKPNIPVILVSGYDLAHVMEGDHPELPQAFLAKPYNLKALRAAISQALESRKT